MLVDSLSSKIFLKDPFSASIPKYLYAVIPYLCLSGVPFFEGSNITNFLESYSQIYIDY